MENKNEEKDNKIYRILCKIVSVILCIARIIIYIAIPCMILTIVLTPLIIKNTKISNNNTVSFKYKDQSANIVKEKGKYIIYANDKKVGKIINVSMYEDIVSEVRDYKSGTLIGYVEIILCLSTIYLVIVTLYLKKIEDLFKAMYSERTPFTSENTNRLCITGKLLIINLLIASIISLVINKFGFVNFNRGLPLTEVVDILVVFIFMYIFKYGETLENK